MIVVMTEVLFIDHYVNKKTFNISEAKSNLSAGGRGKTDPGIESSSFQWVHQSRIPSVCVQPQHGGICSFQNVGFF
jgi:hypothetical protein